MTVTGCFVAGTVAALLLPAVLPAQDGDGASSKALTPAQVRQALRLKLRPLTPRALQALPCISVSRGPGARGFVQDPEITCWAGPEKPCTKAFYFLQLYGKCIYPR